MKKKQKLITKYKKWEVESKLKVNGLKIGSEEVVNLLLENRKIRSIKDKENFINPIPPEKITLDDLGISRIHIRNGIERILKARDKKEKVIIFGDYDVDGICSSAILWEFLYGCKIDVTPYIPERFSEGYGIQIASIEKLKKLYPTLSLIITVDNGIVAYDAVSKAKDLGIDIIIVDHHEKGEKYPDAFSVIHTTKICGSAISWIVVRELSNKVLPKKGIFLNGQNKNGRYHINDSLELAILGTVADQMPQLGVNRSFVKHGLEKLNNTNRVGLMALFNVSGISKGNIGIYEINYIIAPRINAMGRLENAIESLRLLCTKNTKRAFELADLLNRTNQKRQKVVEEIFLKTRKKLIGKKLNKIIILSGRLYHEGVIGLAASKLVEEFFRPAIVISEQKGVSKGSARSIWGFNIIEAIRTASNLILGGGGHEMAAGFSIKSKNITLFKKRLEKYASLKLDDNLLEKKIKIDLELKFSDLTEHLVELLKKMEPFGIGNPNPTFLTGDCDILDIKRVGNSGNHLKLKLKNNNFTFDALFFNSMNNVSDFALGNKLDIVYNFEENVWNGISNLQLKIKDLKYSR